MHKKLPADCIGRGLRKVRTKLWASAKPTKVLTSLMGCSGSSFFEAAMRVLWMNSSRFVPVLSLKARLR